MWDTVYMKKLNQLISLFLGVVFFIASSAPLSAQEFVPSVVRTIPAKKASAPEDFLRVLYKNPYQVDAYTAYASTLAAKGDFENALEVLNLALQLRPSKPEIFFSRAGVYFMLGRFNDAVRDYTSVINLSPAAEVYNARGAAYERMGKTDLAQKDFEEAKTGRMPEKLNVYSMID